MLKLDIKDAEALITLLVTVSLFIVAIFNSFSDVETAGPVLMTTEIYGLFVCGVFYLIYQGK
jgi:hypothetical protein